MSSILPCHFSQPHKQVPVICSKTIAVMTPTGHATANVASNHLRTLPSFAKQIL